MHEQAIDLGGGASVRVRYESVTCPDQGADLDDEIYRLVCGDPDELPGGCPQLSFLSGPALDLVDELRRLGWLVRVQFQPDGFLRFLEDIHAAAYRDPELAVPYRGWINRRVVAWCGVPGRLHETEAVGYGDAAPLAICRAIWATARVPSFRGFRIERGGSE